MNEKSKLKRKTRVRKQKLLQQNKSIAEAKKENLQEKLQRQNRQKNAPIVNDYESILTRNIQVLEQALAEQSQPLQSSKNEEYGEFAPDDGRYINWTPPPQ